MKKNEKVTAIINANVFDGMKSIGKTTVAIKGNNICQVGGEIPADAEVIDGTGCTLLPGLIDAHSHPNMDALKQDLTFGVTTTYQMQGYYSEEQVEAISERHDMAHCLKSFMSIGAPGGHPNELLSPEIKAKQRELIAKLGITINKTATTPEEARQRVEERVAQGSDYIKVMVEDGTVFGHPGTPDLKDEVIAAICNAAHQHGKMAVAHAMSIEASHRAIQGGIDGLMHLFIDRPYTDEIIAEIAQSGIFVCPTIVAAASTIGDSDAAAFATDSRVSSKLSPAWMACMQQQINTYPQGSTADVLKTVKALHDAGVNLLAGSDASQPGVGGMAHGASLHHELQLFVKAGLTPAEALQAATSVPARCFGLDDRGVVAEGKRADLLLVKGDPTTDITNTLSIVSVWRQGTKNAQ